MENIKIYSEKLEKMRFGIKTEKKKGINNELQEVTWEACSFFKEPGKFGMYYGYIKRLGISEARKRIALQKEQGICQPKFFFKPVK